MGKDRGMRDVDPGPLPVNPASCTRLFGAKAARSGGVVRRSMRGFHLIACGDQYLVICHDGHLRVIC